MMDGLSVSWELECYKKKERAVPVKKSWPPDQTNINNKPYFLVFP